MIAVIGIGGAGGNIADEAVKAGFAAGAINFSQRDLDALDNTALKLKLTGSEGVGHNRDEAIRLMQNNWEMSLNFVKEHFSNPSIEIIFIAFSTGGGSGCGVSPMFADILSNTMNKVIVALPIIPDKSEPVVSQINCLKAFEELSNIDVAVFPIDNEKVRSGFAKNQMYEITNTSFVSAIDKLVSYTDKFSKNGNLDRKDLITIFSTKGMGMMAEADIAKIPSDGTALNISKEGFASIVQHSWENSIFTFERKQVIRAGVVFDGQESLMKHLDYEQMFSTFSNGMPIDLFEGNYHEHNGRILTVMTGLSWCNTRLAEIERIIEDKKRSVESAMNNAENQSYQSKSIDLSAKITKQSTKTKSVSEILSKYQR